MASSTWAAFPAGLQVFESIGRQSLYCHFSPSGPKKANCIWATETAHFRECLSVHLSLNSTCQVSWIFKMPALMNLCLWGLLNVPTINKYTTYINIYIYNSIQQLKHCSNQIIFIHVCRYTLIKLPPNSYAYVPLFWLFLLYLNKQCSLEKWCLNLEFFTLPPKVSYRVECLTEDTSV